MNMSLVGQSSIETLSPITVRDFILVYCHISSDTRTVLLKSTTGGGLGLAVKLGDFGCSFVQTASAKDPSTYTGTKTYWAPVWNSPTSALLCYLTEMC
jgi:hypothetical protein